MKEFSLRIPCAFLAVLLAVLCLASCDTGGNVGASEVLRAMVNSQKSLPAGAYYTTKSSVGAPDYLSPSLLAALYGNGEMPPVMERAECASYISSGLYAYEFAVFACVSERDTAEIADLCLARIDAIRFFWNANAERLSLDTSQADGIAKARVIIKGRYVIMALSDDAERAARAAKACLD